MKCPACKEVVLSLSERSGVEIDYCQSCRGVWLDRGELDKIIEKVNQEKGMESPSRNQDPHFSRHPDQYSGYKYKRKKSILEELFD
jgi:Zn-finger nucleic acid-binding protein